MRGALCYRLLPWRTGDQWRLSLALHRLGEPCETPSSLTWPRCRVAGGVRGHRDLIFDVDLSHPRRCELWQLLHQRLRRVRVSINDSSIPREAASRVGWHSDAGSLAGRLMTSEAASSSSIGSTEMTHAGGLAKASGFGLGKQSVAAVAVLSVWSAGAPLSMFFFGLVRRRHWRRLPRDAPPTAPCAAPSASPCGACWEAGGLSRAECHGRLAPFAADVEAGLGHRQSLARCRKPRQRRQCNTLGVTP